MKVRVFLPALVALVLCTLAAAPAARADLGGYVIRQFDADLTVRADADLAVTERIEVNFLEPRHGIYRTIPVRYTDAAGFAYSLGLRFDGVTDGNGRKIPASLSDAGRYVRIRIGDPKSMVEGNVTYVLRYRVLDALGRFPQHDEIYWNVTGNEWNTPVERASATVHLPAALTSDSLQADAYTGRFGEQGKDAAIAFPEAGTVTFTTARPLDSLEGMTIAVAWPTGHVLYPSARQKTSRFLADNVVLFVPLFVFAFLIDQYRRKGRDPRGPASVMVRYDPPEGMTAGEIGTLVDERVDLRDITATIVDLAVRGYLVIRMEKRDVLLGLTHRDETVFEKTKKSAADLLPHEALVYSGIFASGDVVPASDLRQQFYVNLPGIRTALNRRLVANGFFASDPQTVRGTYVALGFGTAVLIVGIGALWIRSRGGILPNGLVPAIIAAAASLALFLAFARAMPRRTEQGVRMRAWARGFEEFVNRVEGEKLEADRARNVFETLLPYAMALGVAARWARRFEGIYQTPPAWFQGGMPGAMFSTMAFEHTLNGAMASAGSSLVASPRSSGSGGGGFSGGGGGGGGGGSW